MSANVTPIPEGFHALTPHLTVRDAPKAIDFYKQAFGAVELMRAPGPSGKVMHATLRIGDSPLMLNDEFPDWGCFSPLHKEGAGFCVHLYVDNVDDVFQVAIAAGAKETMPVQDMFWGDRYGKLTDPFGHHWSIASRKEIVSLEECERRQKAAFAGSGCS